MSVSLGLESEVERVDLDGPVGGRDDQSEGGECGSRREAERSELDAGVSRVETVV